MGKDAFPHAKDPVWELIKQGNPTTHPEWSKRVRAYKDAEDAGLTNKHMFHNKNKNADQKTFCESCTDANNPKCWQCSDMPDILTYFVAGNKSGPKDFGNKHLRFQKTGSDNSIRLPKSKDDY